jgi:hypothetical protein
LVWIHQCPGQSRRSSSHVAHRALRTSKSPKVGSAGQRPVVAGVPARDSLSVERVSDIVARNVFPYRTIEIRKPQGGLREIHRPDDDLMAFQRRLLNDLYDLTSPHPAAYAYVPGVSTVQCAQQHASSHTVIRLDIADFFHSVKERSVFDVLLGLGRSRLSTYELTGLVTIESDSATSRINSGSGPSPVPTPRVAFCPRCGRELTHPERNYMYQGQREGHLPQGAPTSGLLSNLVMKPIDEWLWAYARRHRLRYTRYSDDMHFSSTSTSAVTREVTDALVADVRNVLDAFGFRLNDRKTRVLRPGSRRQVLGLLVDGPTPRLPKEMRRRIDMNLRGVREHGLVRHAAHLGMADAMSAYQYISGLISYASGVEPAWAAIRHGEWAAQPVPLDPAR